MPIDDKTPAPNELSNDNTDSDLIAESDVAEEIIADLTTTGQHKKRTKFALYWLLGLNPKRAALKAGFTKGYAESGIYQRMGPKGWARKEIERILSNVPQRYSDLCRARLLTIGEIEGKALEAYRANPKLAISQPALLKHLKQAAGIMTGDSITVQQTINIGQIQTVVAQIHADRSHIETRDRQKESIDEAETVED